MLIQGSHVTLFALTFFITGSSYPRKNFREQVFQQSLDVDVDRRPKNDIYVLYDVVVLSYTLGKKKPSYKAISQDNIYGKAKNSKSSICFIVNGLKHRKPKISVQKCSISA